MENSTSTNHENGNDANRLLADGWIETNKNLPEIDSWCFFWYGGKIPMIGCYKGDGKFLAMEEMINCKCEKCGVDYEKPVTFKKWNEEKTNVFFRWSLKFCDKCRREKEREALKALPSVLSALAENLKT